MGTTLLAKKYLCVFVPVVKQKVWMDGRGEYRCYFWRKMWVNRIASYDNIEGHDKMVGYNSTVFETMQPETD